jgi:acyl-CoA reductase-like NAD-dependent aldehyde dehydrogenase
MAATDFKITDAEVQAVHVEAQPDVLQGTAQQNKKVFDAYNDMIVEHYNDLCEFIESDMSATISEDTELLYESLGWSYNA